MTTSNIDKYRNDIKNLALRGQMLVNGLIKQNNPKEFQKQVFEKSKSKEDAEKFIKDTPDFQSEYQEWYSEALSLIRQLLPDRIDRLWSLEDIAERIEARQAKPMKRGPYKKAAAI